MPTFESPFDAFELGTFASEHDADLVVGAMSWLDSEPPTAHEGVGTDEATDDPGSVTEWEQVRQVLSYWVLRLNPLIGSGAAFVCANRIGREGGTPQSDSPLQSCGHADAVSCTGRRAVHRFQLCDRAGRPTDSGRTRWQANRATSPRTSRTSGQIGINRLERQNGPDSCCCFLHLHTHSLRDGDDDFADVLGLHDTKGREQARMLERERGVAHLLHLLVGLCDFIPVKRLQGTASQSAQAP